jgi:MYXO-CTERM domain-containing protein
MNLPVARLSAALLLAAATFLPSTANAFCRTWSCDPTKETCPADPGNPACAGGDPVRHRPLYWPQRCIGFSLNQAASAQLDSNPDRARAKFARVADLAFATWQKADCGGKRPSLAFYNLGFIECDRQEFNGYNPSNEARPTAQGNANLIMFRDRWPAEYQNAGNALALTTLTFNVQSGEIYDADIEINGEVSVSTSDVVVTNDLQSILTHEIGHFLGIAHSPDELATMFATYQPGTLGFRDLSPDDVNAVCSIYIPERTGLPSCDPTPRHGYGEKCAVPAPLPDGCSVTRVTPTASAPAAALAVLALALRWRRRKSS